MAGFRSLLDGADDDGAPAPGENTVDIRVVSVFVVLVAGLLGTTCPLMFKCFRNAAHPATVLLRSLSAGVILALALIHVIPDGAGDLAELLDYPVGPCCVIFGVLAMIFIEDAARHGMSSNLPAACHHRHHGQHKQQEEDCEAHLDAGAQAAVQMDKLGQAVEAVEAHDHSHGCMAVQHGERWVTNAQAQDQHQELHDQVVAYLFELGCIIHSVLIGIGLGIVVDDRTEAVTLLLALTFHQGLEGIGLGSVLVRARFTVVRCLFMALTYSLMTPLGIAIGMGTAGTYDPGSTAALAVQGVINCISGGLLLYISLVQLIAEDLSRTHLNGPDRLWLRLGSYVAVTVGAACMAVVGIWA